MGSPPADQASVAGIAIDRDDTGDDLIEEKLHSKIRQMPLTSSRGGGMRFVLPRFDLRKSKIAVARTAGERLGSLEMDAPCGIGRKIEPADTRQNVLVSVTRGEFAEA